jgi:uncharacterized protein (DUF488 family)
MARPFLTIGHSTRPIDEFLELISSVRIQLVVDVRTVPRSRTNPQYNSASLAKALAKSEISYEHLATLGGLRGRSRNVSADVNAFWKNRSFHNYADYAMTEEFRSGLITLCELGHTAQTAIMCAESVWWRCHRRIIADYLLAAGETVFHILSPGHINEAKLTTAARLGPNGTLTYPLAAKSVTTANGPKILH